MNQLMFKNILKMFALILYIKLKQQRDAILV